MLPALFARTCSYIPDQTKPEGYPMPWCDILGAPYCEINLTWCLYRDGWREKQRGKPMSVIIRWIDEVLEKEIRDGTDNKS